MGKSLSFLLQNEGCPSKRGTVGKYDKREEVEWVERKNKEMK